jgi:hypothetical protein
MATPDELQATVDALVQKGKGILAADESGSTIARRFKTIAVESTEENRRACRSLLIAAPGVGPRTHPDRWALTSQPSRSVCGASTRCATAA